MHYNLLFFIRPPQEFVDDLRLLNIVLGAIACLCLLLFYARKNWPYWESARRIAFLALFTCCLTGFYGTFEIKYLDTTLRVPMVTISLLWAIIASLWPNEKREK